MSSTVPALGLREDGFRWRGLVAVLLVVAVIWGWCDVRRRGRVDSARPDAHKTDFTVYTEAGAAFFDGRDPYRVTNVRGWSYLYPPLFALTVSPLARLDTETQTFLWFLVSLAFVVGCCAESRALLALLLEERRGDGKARLAAVLVPAGIAVALPALNCLQRGQIGVLQVYCLLLGFRGIVTATSAWKWFSGGMVLAIPVALKLTPALPVGCVMLMLAVRSLVRAREWKRFGLSAGGLVAGLAAWLLVVPTLILGWDANLKHLNAFSHKVLEQASSVRADDFGGEVDSPRNQSLDNAVYRLGLWLTYRPDVGADGKPLVHVERPRIGELPRVPLANQVSLAINLLLVAGLVFQVILLAREGRTVSLAAGLGLASVLSLIVSPVSRGHYFVMLLPLLLAAPVSLAAGGRTRAARFAVWTPAAVTVLHYLFLNSLGRLGLFGLAIAAWYVAVGVLLVVRRSPDSADIVADPTQDSAPPLRHAA